MGPSEFSFVTTCEDYKREMSRLEIVLWPYNHSEQEHNEAMEKLGTSPLAAGRMTIPKSKVSRAEEDIEGKNYGKIDWINFRLAILPPHARPLKN